MKDRQTQRQKEAAAVGFALLLPSKYKACSCEIPPQHRHPLAQDPRCRVPAASRHSLPNHPAARCISHNMTLYVREAARCHAHCLAAPRPPNTAAAVRAPTRRHPSRHTLTSLSRKAKFGGVAAESEVLASAFSFLLSRKPLPCASTKYGVTKVSLHQCRVEIPALERNQQGR